MFMSKKYFCSCLYSLSTIPLKNPLWVQGDGLAIRKRYVAILFKVGRQGDSLAIQKRYGVVPLEIGEKGDRNIVNCVGILTTSIYIHLTQISFEKANFLSLACHNI